MKFLTVFRSSAPRSPCVSIYLFRSCSQNYLSASSTVLFPAAHLEDKNELGFGVDDIVEPDNVDVLEL